MVGEQNKWNEALRGGGGHKSVRISVKARVRNNGRLFQSFLYAFCRGGWPEGTGSWLWRCVRISEVSAGRESTVVSRSKINTLKLVQKLTYNFRDGTEMLCQLI